MKKSINAVQRLKARAYAEQPRTGAEEKRLASGPRSEGGVTGPGEYRTYFVSETCLETEEDCYARSNVTSLPQLLHIGSDIPESYGRLLRTVNAEDDPVSLLHSMGGVLEIARHVLNCAIELCDCRQRVRG